MNRIKHYPILLALSLCTSLLSAQKVYRIQGIIIDSSSLKAIEYVCAGIIGKDVGTISNDIGLYKLDIPEQHIVDTITFSRIGYQTKMLTAKDLIAQENAKIALVPINKELAEVVITGTGSKERTKGNTTRSRSIVMAISSGSVGSEVGTVIHLPKDSVLINDLNFHITSDRPDSVKFRMNIYGYDKTIGDNLLKTSIYFTITNKFIGDYKVDLRKYHLYMNGNIFISVEPVAIFSKGPDPKNFNDKSYDRINISGTIAGSESFYRKVSLGKWIKIKSSFSPGLWITYQD